jgi:hypothetical protein
VAKQEAEALYKRQTQERITRNRIIKELHTKIVAARKREKQRKEDVETLKKARQPIPTKLLVII